MRVTALALLLVAAAHAATKNVDFTSPDETFSVTKVVEVRASPLLLWRIWTVWRDASSVAFCEQLSADARTCTT